MALHSSSPSLLRADGISHSYGDRTVLVDLSMTADAGQRVGLLGENGAGKSTLLRLLAGAERADRGVVVRPVRTGLLAQEVTVDPDARLAAIVDAAIAPFRALERELQSAAEALGGTDPDAPARYDAALAAASAAELWSLDARRDELLDGLGVADLGLDRAVGSVSGGQRSRVALAALLLSRPDALLLDEPTNHLDDAAVAYLSGVLRGWRGALVFASHDRAFLDEVATELLDIDPSRAAGGGTGATRYGGDYTGYLTAKASERVRWEAQFAAEEAELAGLKESVSTTSRAVAHNRAPRDNDKFLRDFKRDHVQSQIARRVRNAQGRLDELTRSRVAEPPAALTFAGIPRGSHVLDGDEPLLTVEGVRIVDGLGGDRLELDRMRVGPDARLLVSGPNGAGKSTLLGLLAGRLAPDAGRVRRRSGVRVALLDQDVGWSDPSQSPRALYERAVGERHAESLPLGELGLLAPRDLDRPVGVLSIGQQRRTALALIIARPPHVFLLDEPTNHLSLLLATELEDALGEYPGAVVIASHDRWLRRRWRGRMLRLEGGRVARRTDLDGAGAA